MRAVVLKNYQLLLFPSSICFMANTSVVFFPFFQGDYDSDLDSVRSSYRFLYNELS